MQMSLPDRVCRFDRVVEATAPPIGQFLTVNGRRVHHARRGSGGTAPVVLVHGASGNIRDWEISVLPGLAERCEVIAFDRPGFGYSDALPEFGWRLTDQIAHLRGALGQLGVDRFVLAGHSYGGSLAMRWALDHPEEIAGLALIAAPVMDWGGGGIGAHYQLGGRPVIGDLLAQGARFLTSSRHLRETTATVFAPQEMPAGYLEQGGVALALRPRTFRVNSVMMLRLYEQMAEQAKRNPELSVPAEIIHGLEDTIVPAFVHAEPLAVMHPDAGLTLMRDVGHMPHHAEPQAVIAAIERLCRP